MPRCLRSSGTKPLSGNAATAVSTKPIAPGARKQRNSATGIAAPTVAAGATINRAAGNSNDGGPAAGGGRARTSTTPNPNVRACEACFTLHKTEALLIRAERRLAAVVGALGSPGGNTSGRRFGAGVEGGAGGDGEEKEEEEEGLGTIWNVGDGCEVLGRRASTGSLHEVERWRGASGKRQVGGRRFVSARGCCGYRITLPRHAQSGISRHFEVFSPYAKKTNKKWLRGREALCFGYRKKRLRLLLLRVVFGYSFPRTVDRLLSSASYFQLHTQEARCVPCVRWREAGSGVGGASDSHALAVP